MQFKHLSISLTFESASVECPVATGKSSGSPVEMVVEGNAPTWQTLQTDLLCPILVDAQWHLDAARLHHPVEQQRSPPLEHTNGKCT